MDAPGNVVGAFRLPALPLRAAHFGILALLLATAGAYPEKITINKIKVTGNTFTSTKVITAFIREFNEGDMVDFDNLRKLAISVKRRLYMTTWFYSADVYVVKREADSTTANVIIEVQEGYLYRFWGGNAFGGFGKQNISGSGTFAGIEAGYNKQLLTVRRPYGRYYYALSGGNTPLSYTDLRLNDRDVQDIGAQCAIGMNLRHDVKIGLASTADELFSDDYHHLDRFERETIDLGWDTRNDFFSPDKGSFMSCTGGYIAGPGLITAGIDARLYRSLIGKYAKWAGQGKLEAVSGTIRSDFFYPSLCGIDGIRAPAIAGMAGNYMLQIVNELRARIFDETVLGFVDIAAEPALFFAAGCAGETGYYFEKSENYRYSFGIAARLFIGVPVFIPLRLEAGWNESGACSIFFAVSEPF